MCKYIEANIPPLVGGAYRYSRPNSLWTERIPWRPIVWLSQSRELLKKNAGGAKYPQGMRKDTFVPHSA